MPSMSTRSLRRMGLASAALVLLTVAGTGSVGAATATPLGTNLIRNAGAEAGPSSTGGAVASVPSWTISGGGTVVAYGSAGFPAYAHGLTFGGQEQFFFCGAAKRTTFGQLIRIRGRNAHIDAGSLTAVLAMRVGSKGIQGDSGKGMITFLNADKVKIGSAVTQSTQATNGYLQLKSIGQAIPAGTRYLRVQLVGRRFVDNTCDVYFDNIDLRLFS